MGKPRLIILSDLWGGEKSSWVDFYSSMLDDCFEIHYYDCCTLGEIDTSIYEEQSLHRQFVNGGIERAVNALCKKETKEGIVLAFSIGGTIGWRAGRLGLKAQKLIAVSSSRLRYETTQPNCPIQLYYGDKDQNKPDSSWFSRMKIKEQLVLNEGHLLYQTKEFADQLSKKIKQEWLDDDRHAIR